MIKILIYFMTFLVATQLQSKKLDICPTLYSSYNETCPLHDEALPPVFIFDMGGILFDISTFGVMLDIGIGVLANYMWQEKRIPSSTMLKKRLFDLLQGVDSPDASSASSSLRVMHEGLDVPPIFVRFMAGKISSKAATAAAHTHSDLLAARGWFTSDAEKNMLDRIVVTMFDPTIRTANTYAIGAGIDLLLHCKRMGYRVYVLSNWDHECASEAMKKFESVFNYIDGVVISADPRVESNKPHPEIYEELFKRYKLRPEQCYFIDDTRVNIVAANKLGMHGILCEHHDMSPVWEYAHEQGLFGF